MVAIDEGWVVSAYQTSITSREIPSDATNGYSGVAFFCRFLVPGRDALEGVYLSK